MDNPTLSQLKDAVVEAAKEWYAVRGGRLHLSLERMEALSAKRVQKHKNLMAAVRALKEAEKLNG